MKLLFNHLNESQNYFKNGPKKLLEINKLNLKTICDKTNFITSKFYNDI